MDAWQTINLRCNELKITKRAQWRSLEIETEHLNNLAVRIATDFRLQGTRDPHQYQCTAGWTKLVADLAHVAVHRICAFFKYCAPSSDPRLSVPTKMCQHHYLLSLDRPPEIPLIDFPLGEVPFVLDIGDGELGVQRAEPFCPRQSFQFGVDLQDT